jgi:hypothetical protein
MRSFEPFCAERGLRMVAAVNSCLQALKPWHDA